MKSDDLVLSPKDIASNVKEKCHSEGMMLFERKTEPHNKVKKM